MPGLATPLARRRPSACRGPDGRGRPVARRALVRLIFMGTPDFAVPALEALHAAGHEVACAYTQPPRPAGRGGRPRPSPVQRRAEALGIAVRAPESLRVATAQEAFAALGAEVAVVVAYGLILPRAVLAAPGRGCLNIHASLLPRWRGAAPIHRAVMAGDRETGVCVMAMEAGLDTGPVLLREATPIGREETTGDLHDRLAAMGARLIVEALGRLDELVPEPQPEEGVTYAAKIDKAEARVDFSRPAVGVDRLIRGLSPWPGAWTERDGRRLKLLRSRVGSGGLSFPCADGSVEVTEVQPEGRGRMSAEAFLRGTR